jgi:hypothetical protein
LGEKRKKRRSGEGVLLLHEERCWMDPIHYGCNGMQSMERMEVSFGILIHHQGKLG